MSSIQSSRNDIRDSWDVVVVGGGFYGIKLALMLRADGARVIVLEREGDVMQRASYANQARVHNGYHYPRSVPTALRARLSVQRFSSDYGDCIDDTVESYYVVARNFSKVTARDFELFCRRIGAELSRPSTEIVALFDPRSVDGIFGVTEYTFNTDTLRARVTERAVAAGVVLRCSTEALAIQRQEDGGLRVTYRSEGADTVIHARTVLNCTYAGTNTLLRASGIAPLPLQQRLSEIVLVEPPPVLRGRAVTVVDGPFFSCMPFPSRGLHSLTHVRYTHHVTWDDGATAPPLDVRARPTLADRMIRDASRIMPVMQECTYRESLFELKTLLPRSARDDGRPILLHRHADAPDILTVVGAKIDSVYDAQGEVARLLAPHSMRDGGPA